MGFCVFCEILAGRLPASIVYRDDVCCAFMDIRPVNPGHTLIIPVTHAAGLAELERDTGAHMFTVAKNVAAALRLSAVRCEGINFHLADGDAAGQEVFHVHLHVVPRYGGDGFGLRFGPDYGKTSDRKELTAISEVIRSGLKLK